MFRDEKKTTTQTARKLGPFQLGEKLISPCASHKVAIVRLSLSFSSVKVGVARPLRNARYLVEAFDEGRHSVRLVSRALRPGRQVGGAVAQVVDGRHRVEQLVLRLGELERHLLGEGQQPLEDVELVGEGGRQGEHAARQGRLAVRLLARRRGGRARLGGVRVGGVQLLLEVPQGGAEVVQRRVARHDHVPLGGAELERDAVVRSPAAELPLKK